ncbi:MAG: hypothetical protein PHS96_03665 [Anaerolineales bacterium]|nr:hypothetical protein [Anaerolineales bacterium]
MDNSKTTPHLPTPDRLGVHYHRDDQHYRHNDLKTWLPELGRLGVEWLVLAQPARNAIPEPFIRELCTAKITPVLHLESRLEETPGASEWSLLFQAYAKWGVRYVTLFDRPNCREAWLPATWTQANLVERFLDAFLPLAQCALDAGLTPAFPPLAPGGDYWDTAFLRDALQGILARGRSQLLSQIVLTAYADVTHPERPLAWGAGGPERWPGARPYLTPSDQQDQRGFYIFDWYCAISQAIIGKPLAILLFGAGRALNGREDRTPLPDEELITRLVSIAQLMASTPKGDPAPLISTPGGDCDPVPDQVLACAFEIIPTEGVASAPDGRWLDSAVNPSPATAALEEWARERLGKKSDPAPATPKIPLPHPIRHYVLLSPETWELAEGRLESIRPFVRKHLPTIGFSLAEACQARRVTLVGGTAAFSDEEMQRLQAAGCEVERIVGDGTNIASLLNSL